MSEGLDFGAIERAIAAVISRATGLPPEDTSTGGVARVIPEQKQLPQPPFPYITFDIPVPKRIGAQDEIRDSYDPQLPNGQEIVSTAIGQREFIASIKCFTKAAIGGRDIDGNYDARHYLARITTALELPGYVEMLQCAGLVYVDLVSSHTFSARLGPAGQGRGQLEVRFRVVDTMSERTGYIATAEPTGTLS